MKYVAIAAFAALTAGLAQADHRQGFFAGANISYLSSDSIIVSPTDDDEVNIFGLELVGGYKYNSWLGVDVRLGAGLSEQGLASAAGGSFDYSVDGYQSIYYRPEMINTEAKIYALLGYTTIDVTVEQKDDSNTVISEADNSESGTSYGLGVGWFAGEDITINLEYRMLIDKDEDEFSVATFGFDYRF